MNNFLFGNDKISYYETIAGGTGAGNKFNGNTCQVHMTNTRITDLEHLEQKYPVILT
jgi:5-oxoprolinase (ATP-hydrolysing)